ncbi:unnamed protein product [Didymodactylos carnosus]|uniref:Ribosome assembly protein 1 n=1 Tax=Didymodactylos carnosus TaxID=1234261 RepID=A0A8S2GDV4_9BILA|nr:unnamed protein product [Didymodactylos carnosus]CAF3499895.1 unnamed protein product [Didymodactylos carnosus]
MPITATPEVLKNLQQNTESIRNICIIAHVDHGKTTLADDLLAYNSIISTRMAGKLHYMDSREDEQIRGITMKSSAVSLLHIKNNEKYLINLIDSPGHVDFSSEVSTAVRLCDGAIIMVDVVEGVCPQTLAALRQAWLEKLRLILVLNKIDRLILELKMSPFEAYLHIRGILEHLNALVAEQFTSLLLEKSLENNVNIETGDGDNEEVVCDHWSEDEACTCFSPEFNNVLFASALDGWAFGIHHFADMYAKKLSVKREVFMKTLWGDYYFNKKTKRVYKGAQSKGQKPLFVQFILENVWSVYESIIQRRDNDKVEKIALSVNANLSSKDIRHTDPHVPLRLLFNQWLPIAPAVLDMVVDQLPNPKNLSIEKIEQLMCDKSRRFDTLPRETQQLKNAFISCSSDSSEPVIVYIAKLFSIDVSALSKNKPKTLTNEEIAQRRELLKQKQLDKLINKTNESLPPQNESDENLSQPINNDVVNISNVNGTETEHPENQNIFLAFARVYSGVLKRGQKIYVLSPRHDPSLFVGKDLSTVSARSISNHVHEFIVDDLYLMMGREFELLEQVPAGSIIAIAQLDNLILKSATLSTTIFCSAFTGLHFDAAPIVRVAIESKNPGQMKQLRHGMRLLNQADPLVEIMLKKTGEYILCTAGEVHLQRCIEDLTKTFAKIEINVSPPIVPFRETIITKPKFDVLNEAVVTQQVKSTKLKEKPSWLIEDGLAEVRTQNQQCTFLIRAVPLPETITRLLDENSSLLLSIEQAQTKDEKHRVELNDQTIESIRQLKEKLNNEFISSGWDKNTVDQIWSFGPQKSGPNILLNRLQTYKYRKSIWSPLLDVDETKTMNNNGKDENLYKHEYDLSIMNGFQLATAKGSLCEEPLMGVAFIIERWTFDKLVEDHPQTDDQTQEDVQKEQGIEKNESDEISSTRGTENSDDAETLSIISEESTIMIEKRYRLVDKTKIILNRGPLSGQILSTIKEGCKKAFDSQYRRLVAAMYKCEIMCSSEALGRAYGVLNKRNGRVLNESMKDGTSTFIIIAVLPVAESFGFCEEMRTKASGLASPQILGNYWETIDLDPFWEPTTEEEFLHFGEKADFENRARKYMNDVRKRKGAIVTGISFIVVLLLKQLHDKNAVTKEVSRKVVHLGAGTLYLAQYFYYDNCSTKYFNIFPYVLWAIILLTKSMMKSPWSAKSDFVISTMTRNDKGAELLYGPLFFNLSTILCGTIFYKTTTGAVTMAILTWGDGLAAVVGQNYKTRQIYHTKTLAGSCTVFIAGLISSLIYISILVGYQSISIMHLVLTALLATITETLSPSELDNLFLPFVIIVAHFVLA